MEAFESRVARNVTDWKEETNNDITTVASLASTSETPTRKTAVAQSVSNWTEETNNDSTTTVASTSETPTIKTAETTATIGQEIPPVARDSKDQLDGWIKSTAKEVLVTLLRDRASWVNEIIDSDPTFMVRRSRSTAKTIEKIHGQNALFCAYPLKNFITNFRNLKKSLDSERRNASFDQEAYNKEKEKYPVLRTLKAGYPRWNHPLNEAKMLLSQDTEEDGVYQNENLKPKALKALRNEYQSFPDDIFRNRLYKAKSAHKEKPYWQNERNKSMRKRKVLEQDLLKT